MLAAGSVYHPLHEDRMTQVYKVLRMKSATEQVLHKEL